MTDLRIATSYFYHVRFFRPYMIPISTAVWDPKWYHNFKDQNHCYIDRNGVINGLRLNPLKPGDGCSDLCRGLDNCNSKNPDSCAFLRKYREQLDALDFSVFMQNLKQCVNRITPKLDMMGQEPIAVLLFHEKHDNPCSERWPVQQWFKDNGLYVLELMYPVERYY